MLLSKGCKFCIDNFCCIADRRTLLTSNLNSMVIGGQSRI